MLSTTYKRPLAIIAVAGGLLAVAAGPANASSSTPKYAPPTKATSLKVTMEDILVTAVHATPERSALALENTMVSNYVVTPKHSKRARHRGRHHRKGNGGDVTATYDVRGQEHV
jgi:hypothetical protein